MGLDAVLNEDVYLATSEGESLPSLKPLRKNLDRLGKLQTKKNAREKGSSQRSPVGEHLVRHDFIAALVDERRTEFPSPSHPYSG